jgi:lysophospholipase L1-like esterase
MLGSVLLYFTLYVVAIVARERNVADLGMTLSLRSLVLPVLIVSLALTAAAARWSKGHTGVAPKVYVALGASDVVGIGAERPDVEGWVPRVHAGLPPGTPLLNLGISGATLGDVLREEMPPALDAGPYLITIWPGVNDLRAGVDLQTFAGQLDSLLGNLSRSSSRGGAGRPTILVLNIPDLRHLPAFTGAEPGALDTTVRTWNAAMTRVAGRYGAILVDLYAHESELSRHPEYISADGFHPSSAGYQRIAGFVLDALRQHVPSLVP